VGEHGSYLFDLTLCYNALFSDIYTSLQFKEVLFIEKYYIKNMFFGKKKAKNDAENGVIFSFRQIKNDQKS
jgi:hypothetical protein